MPPLRIVHVCQPVEAGAAIVARRLALASRAAGHEVLVVSPPGPLSAWARTDGLAWLRCDLARRPTLSDLRCTATLRRVFAGADVVVMHSSKAGALGRIALRFLPRRRRPASVFVPHGWSFYVPGRARPVYRRFERVAARWVDAIVTVSPEEHQDGQVVLGPRTPVLHLIPNGVDSRRHRPDGPAAGRSAAPLVVCVGRLCEQKGQDLAVSALAAMRDESTRLRLVGDGPARPAIERLARQLGVFDRVEFTGQADDPRPHLRAADVVLVPSRWEGLSLLLLEAMATGCAVVATAAAAGRALGDTGLRFSPEDGVGVLASRLTDLIEDPDRRARLGAAARIRAQENFSLRRTEAEHVRLWSDLVDRRSPATV